MSWFDTAGIANLAKSALTSAQKTIDKALDIQEGNVSIAGKKLSKKDAESFFEAYGLGGKPSSSQSNSREKLQAKPDSDTSQQNVPLQGSGFWADTWGSFFEMKPQTPSKAIESEISDKENKLKETSTKSEETVLSQPHRASLFPSEASNKNEIKQDKIEHTQDDLQNSAWQDISQSPDNVLKEEICEQKENISLEEQIKIQHTESTDFEIKASTSDQNVPDTLSNKLQDNKTVCDIEIKNETADINLTETVSNVDPDDNITSSNFRSADLPLISVTDKSKKPESEYDVIENNEQILELVSESTLVEVTASKSVHQTGDISDSTVEIPDLSINITESIVSWEWGRGEGQKLHEICKTEEPNFMENKLTEPTKKTNKLPDSSFHCDGSFSKNNPWDQIEKSSHFIDESQNSSNEEQNSHHTDGSSNSSKDDDEDTDTAEVKEYDAKSSSSSGSNTTSSSSFVKCSMEETDMGPNREQSPVSTTPSERSDGAKHELEQNTSGDENETATSSDIEILSPPNGENDRHSSPLKHIWLTRPTRFRRSESPTSDSSKDSLMPVVNELEEVNYGSEENYCDKDETLRQSSHSSDEDNINSLLQRQEDLQAVLEAREKKLLELSKENIEIQENEQRLKNLVNKMREDQRKESQDMANLAKEFTQRLSQLEDQLRKTAEERNSLQVQLDETKEDVATRMSAADIEEVLKEKDQQIKELTEEGQKLSKKELQHTTIIKKLRSKIEETDKTMKSQAEKLEENSKEVERLRKSIGAKEEQEKKHIDAIRTLSTTVKKQEKEVSTLKSSLEDSTEKELSLKRSLESTYKDLTELRKSYSVKEKEVEDLKLECEIEAKENVRHMLEDAKKEATQEKEMLLMQMQELRYTLTQHEEEANYREKMFKADIATLQKRIQEAEERNEESTKNMSSATRPLVRQIENLQATYNSHITSWEKIEKNLTDRLSDAQNQLALATERERSAIEKYLEFQSKVTVYESQNSNLRQDKLQLASELETLKSNLMIMEESKTREIYSVDNLKQNLNLEISQLKQDKENLENSITFHLEQLEMERKKVSRLEEELKLKEARSLMASSTMSPCPSPTGSMRSSMGSVHNWSQDDLPETPINHFRMSVYDSLRLGSGSSLIENLQSQLKQREGEILQLQSEIAKLEHIKESLTKDLVELSEHNEQLNNKLDGLSSVEKEYKDLDQKYNTLLQMYGEKVEEADELLLDLDDVKSMYKAQIEELLRNK